MAYLLNNGSIDVKIKECGDSVSVKALGRISRVMEDAGITLGLDYSDVLKAAKIITGINDITKLSYMAMAQSLTPIPGSARVVDVARVPMVVTTSKFRNDSPYPRSEFDGRVSHTETNSALVSWSDTQQRDSAFEIGYDIGVTGSARIGFSNTCGRSTTRSKEVQITAENGVKVPLQPGEAARISLRAERRIVTVKIRYLVEYSGEIVCYFRNRSGTENFNLKRLFKHMRRSGDLSRKVEETIELDYFTDFEVVLSALH